MGKRLKGNMKARVKAPFYTEGKYDKKEKRIVDRKNPFLYSKGIYSTKVRKEDLAEDYITIVSRTHWYLKTYIKTSEIADIKYEMSRIGTFLKDDRLYISYKEPLQKMKYESGLSNYINDDVRISGFDIIPVLIAIKKIQKWIYLK